ncbi:MAG: hypothetical protein KDA33_17580, partial [Phycisphaerales bacterium]|nr:hypothetical protein [Phycisphaerales bacterium]
MWPFGRKRNAGRDSLSLIEAEAYERLCAAIGPWRAEQARKAWIPVTSESNRDEDTSYFGGTPMLNDGANWPECGACGKPAPFCMQRDSRTLPEEAPRFGDGVLQLFYGG